MLHAIPAKVNEKIKCLQSKDKKLNKLFILPESNPVFDFIMFNFSEFLRIDLMLKLKINIKIQKIIILNGSKISDKGSIKSLKKKKNCPGKDLESLKRKISSKLKNINVTNKVRKKNHNEVKKDNFLKRCIT
ncbi:MAG: hypothetical protein VX976_02795 [Pseudomonadota bacterium]|nr:hypothetical protein [Pseudomonadota bacterium]